MITAYKKIVAYRGKNGRGSRMIYWLFYSFIFGILSLAVFSFFYLNGKRLMFSGDGTLQDFHSLVYWGRYLKTFFHTLITDHQFVLPMWDSSIGLGSDILLTLHYYVIGEPLNLLTVFVPERFMELFYELLMIFKFYLAGLSFSAFCLHRKMGRFQTMMGAFIYSFSGYMLLAAVNHIMFASPVIYFPLVLLGMDLIFEGKKPTLFVVMLAICAYSNFYFFYMICALVVIYWGFHCFRSYQRFEWKRIVKSLLHFLVLGLIAVLLAAPILLPMVAELLSTGRFSAENYIPVLYEKDYYLTCLSGFMTSDSYWVGYWTYFGLTAAALFAVLFLFTQKKENRLLKSGFITLLAFLFVPFLGHVLNGFSYPCNRWNWGFAMLTAYIFVALFPSFYHIERDQLRRLLICSFIYGVLVLCIPQARTKYGIISMMIFYIILITSVSVNSKLLPVWSLRLVILFAVCGGIFLNASQEYSLDESDAILAYNDHGVALNQVQNSAIETVKSLNDQEFYRFDQYGVDKIVNTSMLTGEKGTGFYFSMSNGAVSQFLREMELCYPLEYRYFNMDSRSFLDTILNVKYFLMDSNHTEYLPAFYKQDAVTTMGTYTGSYSVYQNENALPFGFTYDSFISRSEYEKLSAVEKQQAILQSIVLEDSTFPEGTPEFCDEKISYSMDSEENVKFEDGKIVVTEAGTSVTLHFQGMADTENYLEWKNLNVDPYSPLEQNAESLDTMKPYDRNRIKSLNRGYREAEAATITVEAGDIEKQNQFRTNRSTSYSGRHDFIYNMGYQKEALSSMKITFQTPGEYTFDELNIICQPLETLQTAVAQRSEATLSNVKESTNQISGSIQLSDPKILCMSIPYSKGFHAMVDGKETDIKQANTMMMAIELPKGEHEIVITYETPYLKVGCMLLMVGMILLILISIVYKGYQRKKRFEMAGMESSVHE